MVFYFSKMCVDLILEILRKMPSFDRWKRSQVSLPVQKTKMKYLKEKKEIITKMKQLSVPFLCV